MKIIENYSHFNGLEFLLVHKPAMWQEIISIINEVDANMYHDPVPKKRMMAGKIFYHPGELESTFKRHFDEKSWEESKDFIKDRIGVKTHFVKDSSIAYDKHLALYVEDKIDVGVEILPMKSLQNQMSSGISYYEGEFYNIIRQGRGVPAVPLVLLGIEP